MFRQISMGAAAVLAAGILAAGCSDDSSGDTIISGGSFPTDTYSASTVEANNVGADGRAFTNPDEFVDPTEASDWFVFRDGDKSMLVYEASADNSSDINLYAQYHDGQKWHAPVELRGGDNDNDDTDSGIGGFKVIFINGQGGLSQEEAGRTGDAVIVWSRQEEGDNLGPNPASSENDQTGALWATYFDVSAVNAAAANGWVRGFQTIGRRIDNEDVVGSSVGDPSPNTFGFVSPGLRRFHFFTEETDGVDSGDPMEGILHIVYRENTAVTTNIDARVFVVPVDLAAVDNELVNLFGTPSAINALLATDDEVQSGFAVQNQMLFYQADVFETGDEATDQEIHVHNFDDAGVDQSAVIGTGTTDNDVSDTTSFATAHGHVSTDEGTDSVYVLYTESGFATDDTPSAGDRDTDTDLFVAMIVDDGTLTVESEEIDAFPDGTITFVADSAKPTGGVGNVSDVDGRISRNGDYLMVLFTQTNTDVNDIDTGTAGVQAPHTNLVLRAVAVQLRKIGAQGAVQDRALADSVSTVEVVDQEIATGAATANTDQADVSNVKFQQELGSGIAASNQATTFDTETRVGGRETAIQSNNFRMNWTYTQFVSLSGATTDDEERLSLSGGEVDLGDTETDAPTLTITTTSVSDAEVAVRDDGFNEFDAQAFDAGDVERDNTGAPAGESGRAIVVFTLSRSNPTADVDGDITLPVGVLRDEGLFVSDNGDAPELLSTDDGGDRQNVVLFIGGATVPANLNTNSAPHHAGTRLDLYWVESGESQSVGAGFGTRQDLMGRSYDKSLTNAQAAPTVEFRFVPEAGTAATAEDPVKLDNPFAAKLGDFGSRAVNASAAGVSFSDVGHIWVATQGSTTEVLFDEGEQLWAQSNSGLAAWRYTAGEPDPILVTDDNQSTSNDQVNDASVFYAPGADNLTKAHVFFTREDNQAGNTYDRAFVRTHN